MTIPSMGTPSERVSTSLGRAVLYCSTRSPALAPMIPSPAEIRLSDNPVTASVLPGWCSTTYGVTLVLTTSTFFRTVELHFLFSALLLTFLLREPEHVLRPTR